MQRIATAASRFADEKLTTKCAGHALRLVTSELSRHAAVKIKSKKRGERARWACPSDCVFDAQFVPADPVVIIQKKQRVSRHKGANGTKEDNNLKVKEATVRPHT